MRRSQRAGVSVWPSGVSTVAPSQRRLRQVALRNNVILNSREFQLAIFVFDSHMVPKDEEYSNYEKDRYEDEKSDSLARETTRRKY